MSNDYWGQPANPENNPENTQGNPPNNPPVYGEPVYGQGDAANAQTPPYSTSEVNSPVAPAAETPVASSDSYGQPSQSYRQAGSYDQNSTSNYGQSNSYGQSPSADYGQATGYGQSTSPDPGASSTYGQSPSADYGQASSYGQSPTGGYSQPSDPTSGMSAADNTYGQSYGGYSNNYGQTSSYGQPAGDSYSQAASSYGQPSDSFGQQPSGGYGVPNAPYNPVAGNGMVPGAGAGQFGPLASFGKRALGWLIDYLAPSTILGMIGAAINSALTTGYEPSTVGTNITNLLFICWAVYNTGYLGGTTGQSFGRRIAKTRMVSATTGQVVGAGKGILRYFCHFVDSLICGIGWLFPLWDTNRQTLADKIVGTVVIDEEAAAMQGFGQQGGYGY